MTSSSQTKTHRFEAEVSQVLRLVINSLYSNKEIFLRELVSNASDALDKVRFRSITEEDLLGEDTSLHIRLIPDEEAKTLTIEDNGVGMTEEELITNLGTIAHSGSRQFMEGLQQAVEANQGGEDVNLIGQFGVGFYSAFLVADKVEVFTRSVDSEQGWRWESDAQDSFIIEPVERAARGTTIVLHLKEDQSKFLTTWTLRDLVRRYSDYVSHPVEVPRTIHPEEGDEEQEPVVTFEQVNSGSALWTRSPSDLDDAQYEEFYKHLTHDWETPLARTHFKIEGTQQFRGLLFVPGQAPFDLYDVESDRGVRLYVKRVFIMEDCKELLPRWLRFVRGVIDSDDLPLNVSRELLQDSRTVQTIRKQVVKKILSMIEGVAKREEEEDYLKFWELFGRVLKEGLHYDPEHAKRLSKLMRYESSAGEDLTSLAEYVERMPTDQPAIYYALGPSRQLLESSPHLEQLKKRGFEILYMVDPIDQFAVMNMSEFDDKKLVSATGEDLGFEEDEAETKEKEEHQKTFEPLTQQFTKVLDDRVQEVRVSDRLTESPVCLVVPEGGLNAHIERVLRANGQSIPETKRILELNPTHSLIQNLNKLQNQERAQDKVSDWIELLYDQALLTEGSPIANPASFSKRVTTLLEHASSSSIVEG